MTRATSGLSDTVFVCLLAVTSIVGAQPLDEIRAPPENDRFSRSIQISGIIGEEFATNEAASIEAGEPPHAGTGGRSVWWTWRAAGNGGVAFRTFGSDFDTVLAAYTGSSIDALTVVASNDDRIGSTESFQSAIAFEVSAGTDYHIVVDGYDGEAGGILLAWSATMVECTQAPTPRDPLPWNDGEVSSSSVALQWNRDLSPIAEVVYGVDDRRDIYEVTDLDLVEAARSVGVLVDSASIANRGGGTFELLAGTLSQTDGVCPSERFASQPSLFPACSAFLVAPDLVMTAGHCLVTEEECGLWAVVFGYEMLGANQPVTTFAASDIFLCAEIVATEDSDQFDDWALMRLSQPVTDRHPLPIRRLGQIPDSQDLVMIGHGLGLPKKITRGARVRENRPPTFFVSNLDAFGGDSGAPVLNSETLNVEGILVRGEPVGFVPRGNCFVVNVCSENGCLGEDATRTTEFDALVPPSTVTYDVYFGPCGAMTLQGQTHDPTWMVDGLEPDVEYCWQIVADNTCGEASSPVWEFTAMLSDTDPEFRRGDVNQDESADVADAVFLLNYLFLSGEVPGCIASGDTDDSSEVTISDATFLLNRLFLGGEPVPEPFESCGVDATPDDLTCEDPRACVDS